MLDSGWLKPGDKIIDPFGGVALGAYHALQFGLHWTGCELEATFHKLGNENIALWNGRYAAHFPKWGTAVLVQGDSRTLASILAGQADGGLSSPPYAGSATEKNSNGVNKKKQYETYRTSGGGASFEKFIATQNKHSAGYGTTSGQLSAMPEGDYQAAVSSPAYADTINSGEGPGVRHDPKTHKSENAFKATSQAAYGASDGQLGGMSAGDWDAAVSSSPFENQIPQQDRNFKMPHDSTGRINVDYGKANGQLGQDTGPTFWSAARQIVEQTYTVLKPGAYVAFVCGDFIRQGKRVHFGQQWMELCQAVGFEPVEYVTAWKREPGPIQTGMFGDVDKTIDRVSFFRRLANQRNPDNEIVNEDVIFMRKPL